MNPADPNAKLFEFIQSITPVGSVQPGSDQMELDSLQLLQVVAYLEQNFGVRLEDYNVDVEDLRSAKGLAALIERFPR
jgi:acyl carrier protein